MNGRRWQVCKSTAGEWMSFDLNGSDSQTAKLTYHDSQPEAMEATCAKIRRENGA